MQASPRKGPYLLLEKVRTVPLIFFRYVCKIAGYMEPWQAALLVCVSAQGFSEERATSSCTEGSDSALVFVYLG